jgi:hypothetical protein
MSSGKRHLELVREALAQGLASSRVVRQPKVAPHHVLQQPLARFLRVQLIHSKD